MNPVEIILALAVLTALGIAVQAHINHLTFKAEAQTDIKALEAKFSHPVTVVVPAPTPAPAISPVAPAVVAAAAPVTAA